MRRPVLLCCCCRCCHMPPSSAPPLPAHRTGLVPECASTTTCSSSSSPVWHGAGSWPVPLRAVAFSGSDTVAGVARAWTMICDVRHISRDFGSGAGRIPGIFGNGAGRLRTSASGGRGHNRLRLFLDGGEVVRAAEGFGVELVHVLGAGRAGGEPSGLGDHLEAADRRAVAGGRGQRRDDLLTRELGGGYLFGRQPRQRGLLLSGGRGVNASVGGCSVPVGEATVKLRRRLPGNRDDLRGEQR